MPTNQRDSHPQGFWLNLCRDARATRSQLLVVIAFVVAVQLIWYLMSNWITTYEYRIDITWDIMLIAGAVTFVVALLTVLWQSVIATYANPVRSLKD